MHIPSTQSSNSNSPVPTPVNSQIERVRERLKLIDMQVAKQSQEEKLNQMRMVLREETAAILLPAIQDAMAQMTLQMIPDPRLTQAVERNSADLGRLAEGVGQLTSMQEKMEQATRAAAKSAADSLEQLAAVTIEEVSKNNTRSADELLREQRTMAKRQRFWTVATMGVVTLVMLTGTLGVVAYLRWEQKSRLSSEINQLQMDKAKSQQETDEVLRSNADAKTRHEAILAEVDQLRAEETRIRLQIKNSTETVSAMDQVRAKAQDDVGKLQDIQEKNRFKLLQGQGKAIFVEVPENSKAFQYQGKTYIKVQE
jgi:uncharacterized membrane protein YidH (DUF202 family)